MLIVSVFSWPQLKILAIGLANKTRGLDPTGKCTLDKFTKSDSDVVSCSFFLYSLDLSCKFYLSGLETRQGTWAWQSSYVLTRQ